MHGVGLAPMALAPAHAPAPGDRRSDSSRRGFSASALKATRFASSSGIPTTTRATRVRSGASLHGLALGAGPTTRRSSSRLGSRGLRGVFGRRPLSTWVRRRVAPSHSKRASWCGREPWYGGKPMPTSFSAAVAGERAEVAAIGSQVASPSCGTFSEVGPTAAVHVERQCAPSHDPGPSDPRIAPDGPGVPLERSMVEAPSGVGHGEGLAVQVAADVCGLLVEHRLDAVMPDAGLRVAAHLRRTGPAR